MSDEDILVTVMLEQPELRREMQAQHVPDRSGENQHCSACPGVTRGRAVWPCGIRQAADRAETLLRLRAKAAQGRERLERQGGPLNVTHDDTTSGPPRPGSRPAHNAARPTR